MSWVKELRTIGLWREELLLPIGSDSESMESPLSLTINSRERERVVCEVFINDAMDSAIKWGSFETWRKMTNTTKQRSCSFSVLALNVVAVLHFSCFTWKKKKRIQQSHLV